jgi:hypothetical protein
MARIKVESKSSPKFASHGFLKKKDVLLEAKTRSGKGSKSAIASFKVRRRRLKRQGTPSSKFLKTPYYVLPYTFVALLTMIGYAIDQIKKVQKFIHQKPQKGAFYRVVRDIVEEISPGIHLQNSAFAALREAAEAHLIKYFKGIYFPIFLCCYMVITRSANFLVMDLTANHANRTTIYIEDSEFVKGLLGCFGPSDVRK